MNDDKDVLNEGEDIDFNIIDQKADVGIRWNTISLTYSAITQFVMMVFLARLFTPEEYGIMGLILIVLGFGIAFSDVGVSGAVIHYQKVSKRQISTIFWITFIIGFLIFLILVLIAPLISIFYNKSELTSLIRVTAIIFLIIPVGQQFETLLRKDLVFRSIALIDVITSTILVGSSIILAFYGWGVMSVVIGYILRSLVKSCLLLIIGLKIWKPSFEFKLSEVNNFLSFGFYQMGERSINLLNSNFDKILIGKFLGTTALGYYTIAYNLVLYPINLINPIFTRVSFPYFSKMQNNVKMLKEKYLDLISTVSSINFPILLLLFLIAPNFVPLLYGVQWSPSIILVQILSLIGLFRSIHNPVGSLLLAKGYAKRGFFWNAVVAAIQPVIIILGVYFGGLNEVAIAFLLSNFILFYFFYLFLVKKVLEPCFKDYLKSFGIFLLFSILATYISFLGGLGFWTPSNLYQSLFYVSLGGIAYLCLIFIFKREFLIDFIKRFIKKH
ncbi:MAG: MOP flippase family protein [Promethearchaeota archaeon]